MTGHIDDPSGIHCGGALRIGRKKKENSTKKNEGKKIGTTRKKKMRKAAGKEDRHVKSQVHLGLSYGPTGLNGNDRIPKPKRLWNHGC